MLTMHSLLSPTKKPTSVPARRRSGSGSSAAKSSSKPPPLSSSSSSASKARQVNTAAKLASGASKTYAPSAFQSSTSSSASSSTTPSKPKLTIATSTNGTAPLSHSPHSASAVGSGTTVPPLTSPNPSKLRSRSGSNSTTSASSSTTNPSPSSSVSSTSAVTPASLSSLPKASTPTSFPSLVSPSITTATSSYSSSFTSSLYSSSSSIVAPSPSFSSSTSSSVSFLAAPASPIHSASPSQRKLKQALAERLTPKPALNGNSNGNGSAPTTSSSAAFNFRLDDDSASSSSSSSASSMSSATSALASLSLSSPSAEEEVAVEPVLFSPNYEAHDHEEVEKESKKPAVKGLEKKTGRNRGSSVKAILKDKDKLVAAASVVAAIVAQTHTHSAKDAVAVLPAAKPAIAAAAAGPSSMSAPPPMAPLSPKTAAVQTYTYTPPTVQNGGLEEDEFDPFLFIKSLPPLASLPLSLSRPAKFCLPKKSGTAAPITLALDLDETLVHCSVVPLAKYDLQFNVNFNGMNYAVYVKRRPFLFEFLEKVSQWFEVLVFTASQKVYADKLLNILDPARKYIQHRVFRDSCLCIEGNYLKDLTVLGRDMQKTIIIDNSIQAFAYQLNNGIPIESWFDDEMDRELLNLVPFLEQLKNVEDVRPVIRDAFRLQEIVDNLKV